MLVGHSASLAAGETVTVTAVAVTMATMAAETVLATAVGVADAAW